MRVIYGKEVFETLEEVVDPKHTALILVDMQNDFCIPGGDFEHTGEKTYALEPREVQKVVPKLVSFLAAAREENILVVFTQNTTLIGGLSDSGSWIAGLIRVGLRKDGSPPYTVEGTWGQHIIDELKPLPNELVVKKYRSNAFHPGTNLDFLLRNNNIKSVLITGTVTRGCVETTAFGAAFHDYYAVILSDCVAPEDKTLEPKVAYNVATSDDILRSWAVLHM